MAEYIGRDAEPHAEVPENLDAMTPREAWNSAVGACMEISDWSAYWDDGQSAATRIGKLLAENGVTYPDTAGEQLLSREPE